MTRPKDSMFAARLSVTLGMLLLSVTVTMAAVMWPPPTGGTTKGTGWDCNQLFGPNGTGSCTHYDATTCSTAANDPNLAGVCPGYPYLKCHDFRAYGECRVLTGAPGCTYYSNVVCAQLTFYQNANCTNPPGVQACKQWVTVSPDICLP
jgi:hypothetical protein